MKQELQRACLELRGSLKLAKQALSSLPGNVLCSVNPGAGNPQVAEVLYYRQVFTKRKQLLFQTPDEKLTNTILLFVGHTL